MGPVASLRASWRLTRGHKWRIFLYGLAAAVFLILCGLLQLIPVGIVSATGLPIWTLLTAELLLCIPLLLISFVVAVGGWVSAYDELLAHYERSLLEETAAETAAPAEA